VDLTEPLLLPKTKWHSPIKPLLRFSSTPLNKIFNSSTEIASVFFEFKICDLLSVEHEKENSIAMQ
jgi:hypothetical protein